MQNVAIKLADISHCEERLCRAIRQRTCRYPRSRVCSLRSSVSWDCKQASSTVSRKIMNCQKVEANWNIYIQRPKNMTKKILK
jgi:hypothetical protein